jgi:hypothetical protein
MTDHRTNSDIDDAILQSARLRFKKVAKIVWDAATRLYGDKCGNDEYYLIADRIEVLVDEKRLDAQGDLKNWRHSEVRKPEGSIEA